MTIDAAVELIRPAVSTEGGTWADMGAGEGLFTLALAHIIGPSGRIIAIDRDPHAVDSLNRLDQQSELAHSDEASAPPSSGRSESSGSSGLIASSGRLSAALPPRRKSADINAVQGDFQNLDAIEELDGIHLAGANFANALHFTPTPDAVLAGVAGRLQEEAPIIVVEYDRTSANRWVPYPINPDRLSLIASQVGLTSPRIVGRRRSAFGGSMYCAVLQVLPGGA